MKLGFPLLPPGIKNIAIGTFSRGSAGAQSITGLGFVPKIIILFAYSADISVEVYSHGFDNVASHYCMYKMGDGVGEYGSAIRSIVVANGAANFIRGYVSSMDADGFTVTWDLTGAATANVYYLAMR